MLPIERKIIAELSAIYLVGALIALELHMGLEVGTAPQWLTAVVAVCALGIAWVSVRSQREIARKRAAIDFFAKTEMDKHTLEQHRSYKMAVEKLSEHVQRNEPLDDFAKTKEYWHIRDYLNLHELMGVGINQEVFDDFVCEDFWSGELYRACRDNAALIEWIQAQPDEVGTYVELTSVNKRWKDRGRLKHS